MGRMLRTTFVVALLLAACHKSDGPSSNGNESAPASSGVAQNPLVAEVCKKAVCTGRMAQITLWRDKQGAVRVLEYAGDIQRCSHPPTVFYDASGKEIAAIPNKPVAVGSDEQKKFAQIRDDAVKDLRKGDSVFCEVNN